MEEGGKGVVGGRGWHGGRHPGPSARPLAPSHPPPPPLFPQISLAHRAAIGVCQRGRPATPARGLLCDGVSQQHQAGAGGWAG